MSKSSKSKGILSGLMSNEIKEDLSKDSHVDESKEALSVKRSFSLRPSTVRKLQILKTKYDNINITFNEIVDEAIQKLYEEKENK